MIKNIYLICYCCNLLLHWYYVLYGLFPLCDYLLRNYLALCIIVLQIAMCVLKFMQACVERIKGDETGHKHCTGQYFDYWKCVDNCVSIQVFVLFCILLLEQSRKCESAKVSFSIHRLHWSFLSNWSDQEKSIVHKFSVSCGFNL